MPLPLFSFCANLDSLMGLQQDCRERMLTMQKEAETEIAKQVSHYLKTLAFSVNPEAAALSAMMGFCQKALQSGNAADVIPLLNALRKLKPADPVVGRLLGFALRQEQRLVEAEAVFAASAAGADPALRFGLAQTRYELGLPAANLYREAQLALSGAPDGLSFDIIRNRAAAMASEGDFAGAEHLLLTTLERQPDWLDGHKGLSTLRWTMANETHFADSYAAACRAQPANPALWLAWFAAVAQTRNWPAARSILDQAEQHLGSTPGIMASRFFIASESGDTASADALYVATAQIQGDATNLTRIRYLLRRGRFDEAQNVALPLTKTPSAALFWPYLSLIWRLTGDARHLWLDNPDVFIRSVDVDLNAADYRELAGVLRALHVLERPYVEQSVRGGTQTDRSVILRHEPILQKTRIRWMEAIRGYIACLPPHEEGHPLLGTPRNHVLIEGSWSVRLLQNGHNVPHNHPMGWLSTAFYIALPDATQMGPPPSGHIAFGTPPTDLGLDLPPYRYIAPKVGQSAVFPSTTWHSTVPFKGGERLALALDVRKPNY